MGTPETRLECLKLASQFGLQQDDVLKLAGRMVEFIYGSPNKEAGASSSIREVTRATAG